MKTLSYLCLSVLVAFHYLLLHSKPFHWPRGRYHETLKNVTAQVRILSPEETAELFDGHGIRLINKDRSIIPLKIQIHNSNTTALSLKESDVHLSLINIGEESDSPWQSFTYTTRGALLGTLIGPAIASALVIGAALVIPSVSMSILGPVALGASIACSSLGGTIGYLYAQPAHYSVHHGPYEKIVRTSRELIVQPGQTKECLIFVPFKKLKQSFTITLTDIERHENILFSASFDT
jgi:hypothetical protein